MIKLLNPMDIKIYARWYFHKATLVKKLKPGGSGVHI